MAELSKRAEILSRELWKSGQMGTGKWLSTIPI